MWVPLKGSFCWLFSWHLFTELLLAALVSPHNFSFLSILPFINYRFDFLLECWYFHAISVAFRELLWCHCWISVKLSEHKYTGTIWWNFITILLLTTLYVRICFLLFKHLRVYFSSSNLTYLYTFNSNSCYTHTLTHISRPCFRCFCCRLWTGK